MKYKLLVLMLIPATLCIALVLCDMPTLLDLVLFVMGAKFDINQFSYLQER